jgi:hypothetical protein
MRFQIFKMFRQYNIEYKVIKKKLPNYLGNMVTVNHGVVTREMVTELIKRMSDNNFANCRGYNNELIKKESIRKLRKFRETL